MEQAHSPPPPRYWWVNPVVMVVIALASPVYGPWVKNAAEPYMSDSTPYIAGLIVAITTTGWLWANYDVSRWYATNKEIEKWKEWLEKLHKHADNGGFTQAWVTADSRFSLHENCAMFRICIHTDSAVPLRYGPIKIGNVSLLRGEGHGQQVGTGQAVYASYIEGSAVENGVDIIAEFRVTVTPPPSYALTTYTFNDWGIALCNDQGVPSGKMLKLPKLSGNLLVTKEPLP